MWGFKGFPSFDANLGRWVLAAEDICFRNAFYSYIFRLGKSSLSQNPFTCKLSNFLCLKVIGIDWLHKGNGGLHG